MPASACPARSAAPGRHRNPRRRTSAPRPPHTADLDDPGERMGVAREHGERGFFKIGRQIIIIQRSIPGVRSAISYQPSLSFLWVNGRAVHSGCQKVRFKSPAVSQFFPTLTAQGPRSRGFKPRLLSTFCMGFCMTSLFLVPLYVWVWYLWFLLYSRLTALFFAFFRNTIFSSQGVLTFFLCPPFILLFWVAVSDSSLTYYDYDYYYYYLEALA